MISPIDSGLLNELRQSVRDCSDRGLYVASKWSSELLLAIPVHTRDALLSTHASTFSTSTPARSTSPQLVFSFSNPSPAPTNAPLIPSTPVAQSHIPQLFKHQPDNDMEEIEWETSEDVSLAAARAFFGSKEYLRAVHVLRHCKSTTARFLSIYSQYLASEKKALRHWDRVANSRHQTPLPVNPSILQFLQTVQNDTDPWLLFLKSLFLFRLSRREEAIESALLSIAGYPWNWSLWTLLGSCIGDGEELSSILPLIPLPSTHPLVQLFQVKTMNELHSPSENELAICDHLLSDDFFRGSLWIMSLRACVLYHLHDFGQAEVQFERILSLDPYRIDDIDVYSNILYVTDNRLKLSRLAHDFLELDKDRPEVCCLVGNHHSLRAEHEKAVKYFRRATQLDRTYLSAWTLMGHEFVEMKNSHAAIEAYRRAIDVNRKDYRAWYGLGQAYELLSMHQYALHYYQHATALRPYDVRLWQAQGMCYEEIGRLREAVECMKRALLGADPHETTITLKLAKLYEELGEPPEAVAYHRRVVEVSRANMRQVQDYAKSSIYVARYQMTIANGDMSLAQEYLEKVAQSNAEEVAQASDWLKRLKTVTTAKSIRPE
ncbi:hypothetical protein SERLA73DRAFT_106741 [Serpula lacrymans var. lacrymans S7.3]|uniref:Cdc23 domain-containing protein n=2 Tax=Serpula lacrymans var. lacrymans TaxID=341189 RepID=F8PW21_SERL3|nr:uncharacterized protein SERLADRAFT_448425 [Serpula lacrymans var. lacrymans S7.9]EGN99880.1 hypothetical protein SERLA73DRAFT_106741 [Serpula lacrymans var. lacrymans S7.3]EGO25449.1 hypothetical protein SERLADRAFT_448425 [Serpula lacrymans var. lacrymans S7.9]